MVDVRAKADNVDHECTSMEILNAPCRMQPTYLQKAAKLTIKHFMQQLVFLAYATMLNFLAYMMRCSGKVREFQLNRCHVVTIALDAIRCVVFSPSWNQMLNDVMCLAGCAYTAVVWYSLLILHYLCSFCLLVKTCVHPPSQHMTQSTKQAFNKCMTCCRCMFAHAANGGILFTRSL